MKSVLIAGSLCFLQSCYIADGLFLEDPPPPRPSLQEKCEDAVTGYIRGRITSEKYRSYRFTEAIIYVPQELINLEEMEEDREQGFTDGAKTDSIIAARRQYIETNKIQRTVEIEHFFTLKTTDGNLQVLEANYVLNDTLGVLDFEPITILEIPDYYEQALNYFFYNYTIFNSPYVHEARKLSNDFYEFFKKELGQKTGIQARSDFYFNCLKLTEMVRVSGAFDPNQIAQALVHDDQVETVSENLQQKDIDFSPLYEKRVDDNLQGYYIFYKFSQTTGGNIDTAVLRFDFSPFYEIESKTVMYPPFDDYF